LRPFGVRREELLGCLRRQRPLPMLEHDAPHLMRY
jgi:hypothetical protein